jgi:hypothetical protein
MAAADQVTTPAAPSRRADRSGGRAIRRRAKFARRALAFVPVLALFSAAATRAKDLRMEGRLSRRGAAGVFIASVAVLDMIARMPALVRKQL